MQSLSPYVPRYQNNTIKIVLNTEKKKLLISKITPSNLSPTAKEKLLKLYKQDMDFFSTQGNAHPKLPQGKTSKHKAFAGEAHFKTDYSFSLVKDPLWKCVCVEVARMMGYTSALKIKNSQLGFFSSHDKVTNIYCETEEIAQFIQLYSFVIIGCLQQYFPALKELRVKINNLF